MKTSQVEIIKRILREEGKIDNFRSIDEKISIRLGARIADLKKEGWRFKTHKDTTNPKNFVYEVEFDPDTNNTIIGTFEKLTPRAESRVIEANNIIKKKQLRLFGRIFNK